MLHELNPSTVYSTRAALCQPAISLVRPHKMNTPQCGGGGGGSRGVGWDPPVGGGPTMHYTVPVVLMVVPVTGAAFADHMGHLICASLFPHIM